MQWRHAHIYKPIWDIEMKIHGYNHIRVLKCLKRKLGTCKESFDIIDYKDEPTIITKATVVIKCLLSFLEFHKALVFLKVVVLKVKSRTKKRKEINMKPTPSPTSER
jgi:hypothetical protein